MGICIVGYRGWTSGVRRRQAGVPAEAAFGTVATRTAEIRTKPVNHGSDIDPRGHRARVYAHQLHRWPEVPQTDGYPRGEDRRTGKEPIH